MESPVRPLRDPKAPLSADELRAGTRSRMNGTTPEHVLRQAADAPNNLRPIPMRDLGGAEESDDDISFADVRPAWIVPLRGTPKNPCMVAFLRPILAELCRNIGCASALENSHLSQITRPEHFTLAVLEFLYGEPLGAALASVTKAPTPGQSRYKQGAARWAYELVALIRQK